MRHALALAPENRVTQLLLGEMLALSVTPENLTEATNLLEKVAGTSDAESLQALVLLARNRNLDEKAMRDVLRRLRAHPLLDDNGRMAAWELEKRLTPYEGKAILGRAADSFKPTGVARRAVAARWLYDLGEPALALELAHAPDAAGNQDLFKVREDALANLGQWAEVKKELDDPAAPLPPYLIWLYRARCAAQLGSPAESDADWERARDEGSHQPGALAKMADYSLQLGFYAEARKTLARMAQSPTEAKMGYIALLQLEASHGATTDLLATLRQMTIDFPMEPEPRNDWAYLSLLLNQNVEKATQTAQSLVRDHPQFLAYRSTLALACLRHNDPQAAAQAYAALQVDWEGCPASWKMIYATVLAAQGKQTEGLTFVHDVRAEQLRPAELAFFKTYFPGT
jgi:tetratricopeptide (TPR) repeat protein